MDLGWDSALRWNPCKTRLLPYIANFWNACCKYVIFNLLTIPLKPGVDAIPSSHSYSLHRVQTSQFLMDCVLTPHSKPAPLGRSNRFTISWIGTVGDAHFFLAAMWICNYRGNIRTPSGSTTSCFLVFFNIFSGISRFTIESPRWVSHYGCYSTARLALQF